MAEFTLGLTKTAVEGTLSLVKSAIEEEEKLRETVQNDLVFIGSEFEMMRSFLRVANKERARNDEVVLTLVRQLRTLAFDVEDCVEYVVHLDLDKSSSWGWLRRLWQKVNCRAPPLPLDVVVADIKQLKARVEDMSERNMRYNSLILHGSNNTDNKQQQPVTVMPLPAEEPPYATTTTTTYPSSAAFHVLRDAWEATGKWSNNMCNLQQELLIAHEGEDDHDLQVISVWGSTTGGGGGADLGTASIFRKAYRDPKICEKFKIRAWVKLTHPFNHDEFVKSLLAQFSVSSSHQANATGVDLSWTRKKTTEVLEADNLMEQMEEHKYLVVLEDLFTLEEWDVIRMYLPDNKNGSRIIVSTPQLGIALMCTGERYQVSELRKFPGDNQFLCAFFKKKKRLDMVEFNRQLRRHGVISMWGADDDGISNFVNILYKGIINCWLKEFEWVADADKSDHFDMLYKGIMNRMRRLEVEFKQHSWVDVPDPFNLKVFSQRLFLNFHSDDIRASEIRNGSTTGEAGLIDWCRKVLFGEDYLVVINGLQSTDDWDLIESTFLSSKAAAKGCILVITNEETVATYCVDHKYQAFNITDLKADTSISSLINKGSWYYGIRGMKGRLFYDRRKDALEWTNKFKNVGGNNSDEGINEEEFGVFAVSEHDDDIAVIIPVIYSRGVFRRIGILRHAYYGAFQQIEQRSWVDVPNPFDLMDFSWRLLLDFHSDDPQAKEAIAVGLMEGTVRDPIQECLKILRNKKCLVVINGLGSTTDWDSIKDTFLSEHIQSIIIVNSLYIELNTYCNTKALRLGTQQGFTNAYDKEYDCIFYSERCQKALEWAEKFEPVGREREVDHLNHCVFNIHGLFSVWGILGVGKSTLIRTIYYTEMLRSSNTKQMLSHNNFFQAFGWVNVPSPFNMTEFAWFLLLDLYSDDPQAKQTATVSMMEEGQVPILECCKILREIRCLVVIDGLRSTQDWDLIKATFLSEPINGKGTIVVITNEEKVAKHCVDNAEDRVNNIRSLEADAALNLLEKIASEDEQLTFEEVELSKSIVAKCGGLPKVIAAIGEVCRSGRWWMEYLNVNFMGTLEMEPGFHGLRDLFSWMQSYFDACSDSLKPCIFYLSIFSADKNIRWRRLLWRWIAEGYCRDTSDGTTCEENGKKYIFELVNLSIIQESGIIKVLGQINGFFHEYIISRPMEDNLVFALEGRCSLNSQRAGQHLTIRSSWDRRDRIVYESIDFSRLRSLTVSGKWESFFCSKKVNMRLLRVLDLEDATDVTNEDLEQIAKLQTRLKFLSLRGCREITRLPSSIGGMRQLETLDVRHTCVVTLPPVITKLQKLRYIRGGTTTEVWDWEGDIVSSLEATNLPIEDEDHGPASTEDEDKASTQTLEGGDGMVMNLPKDGEDRASSSAQVSNLPAAAAATPTQGGTDSMATVLPPDAGSLVSCNNRPRTLVSSLMSKLCKRGGLDNGRLDNGGVKVPADIEKLAILHTLGVVNVNCTSCGKSIFEELKMLTQLLKLSVSGINKGNIFKFCEAISVLRHLKSLSMEVDRDGGNLDDLDEYDIPEPPKTLESLKLYGYVHNLLVWTEQLRNLAKLKLDLTIVKPEELRRLDMPLGCVLRHLRVRPIQDGALEIQGEYLYARVVEIQCSSVLHIKFDGGHLSRVEVFMVHFSGGSRSSLQISGLRNLWELKEVWLKGHSDAHRQYMQRKIDLLQRQKRPVLKLVQPRSSSSSSSSFSS